MLLMVGQSFNKFSIFVQDIDGTGKLPPIVVVGNKCDLEEQRVVSQAEGEALSKSFGPSATFIEASAKANIGIDNVSIYITIQIHNKIFSYFISRYQLSGNMVLLTYRYTHTALNS